ncbi:MAG: protein phosphatase 2C domain-containing protein [Bacteroidetes bacterium]|nr:protein phosphatase 2C domain-containing protein [Bacteroidota bacterium]
MIKPEDYIRHLLLNKGYALTPANEKLFNTFASDEGNGEAVKIILENQQLLMDKWQIADRINEVMQKQLMIPNATVNKPYSTELDFKKLGWEDVVVLSFEGFEEFGLTYEPETKVISGSPDRSGDYKVKLRFRISGEPEDAGHEKLVSFIVNPDPKSLWKNIESNREDPYWKKDNVEVMDQLGEKTIVVASRRGRSHANVGSFRDDDFSYKYLNDSGWSIVAVSDGAGSAKLSRKGSEIACKTVIEHFSEKLAGNFLKEVDSLVKEYKEDAESSLKKLNLFVYTNLGEAALKTHKELQRFAEENNAEIKDLHSTLIFTLFKKYEFGYAVFSFGVGDCPMAILNKDCTEVTLMNWLDVGEFSGGTRFITMPEIFNSEKFSTRFSFKLIEDFSFLFLMTDGIYDPKFAVEANLEKMECWKEFIEDLEGKNSDNVKVEFVKQNKELPQQLASWMDFWSPGNHDDRTLAVIF